MPDGRLRRGDLVEVKSHAEILATLDNRGMLDGLPFMPEMVGFCGRRFAVNSNADKICDTMFIGGSRALPDSVLLEDLRCDGSGHGGCQAGCRLFWKEAWLRRVDVDADSAPESRADGDARTTLIQLAELNTRQADKYRCQATEHYRASYSLRTFDPRPYFRQYTSGNVNLGRFLKIVARAAIRQPLLKLRLRSTMPVKPSGRQAVPDPTLGLQPGDLVRVKTTAEIAATLTPDGFTRGIWFDDEAVPYCGQTYRVRERVTRYIDEHDGHMVDDPSHDWLTLNRVVCTGDYSLGRWFCPRNFAVQWTEAWLERVEPS